MQRESRPSMSRLRMSIASSSRIKVSASAAFKSRGARGTFSSTSKQHQGQQTASSVLQRRERLRVIEEGEDVTPRNLTHPIYGSLEGKRTAFDAIVSLTQGKEGSRPGSISQQGQRFSLNTVSSVSSIYTIDDAMGVGQTDSIISSPRPSLKGSIKGLDIYRIDEDEEAPSQFHLPRFDTRDFTSFDDKVTITLKETETFFIFELAQLTENAETEEGEALVAENERYQSIISGGSRKTVDAEGQTPQTYTKARGTFIGRQQRKNTATYVNNWVMHDTYELEKQMGAGDTGEESRFKFQEAKIVEKHLDPEDQLASIAALEQYEEATRVSLRILASKHYEKAQKRFAGMLRQDPCDPSLELVYGLDLLWEHAHPSVERRPASTFRWNPINSSLLAVGYGALKKSKSNNEDQPPDGMVLIWCAKNPSEPDRNYKFSSPVSDLDWSRSKPNLLAIGFYDGIVRVIDVSKRQLTIIRESNRLTSPSYEPHWQIQWWPVGAKAFDLQNQEQLYTSNQDGRISYYPIDEDFASHEILRVRRIEGKIPGIRRVNHCLGHDVPISRTAGVLLLRQHPTQRGGYLVGTEEGCVHRCSLSRPHSHLESFLAHDGPIYTLEYSPFCSKLMLTCGADWTTRIWAEGLNEPLLTFGTKMASVNAAAWSPRNSTVFASAVENEICIWDVRRKTHRPASISKVAPQGAKLLSLEFTRSGEQLVATDDSGVVYVYGLVGMPLPPYEQMCSLVHAVRKALLTKPELLRKLTKLGQPFGD